MIRRLAILLLALALFTPCQAIAQSSPAPSLPLPVLITVGGTFQVLRPSNENRRSLTIQNNNDTDGCRLLIGGPWQAGDTQATTRTINGVTVNGKQGSISLVAAGSYTRYAPYVPNDQILVTCTTTGSSVYVDVQ